MAALPTFVIRYNLVAQFVGCKLITLITLITVMRLTILITLITPMTIGRDASSLRSYLFCV
jgi:hypothetical protein